MQTPLTRLLGIRLPILQGGMSWVSRHGLAAAVSEAGGLGVLGAATMDPEELREEIGRLRAHTRAPFGVNVPLVLLRPDGGDRVGELIEVVIAERVPIVITGAGSPRRFSADLAAAGCLVGHVVPSAELALKALEAGVHFVVAESNESGGHVRSGGLATLSLVPQVVDAVPCPVAAAGGIVDARGVLAALALGADGAQMGTRLVATRECEAHAAYKRALIEAGPEDAVLYGASPRVSRGLRTEFVRRLIELERGGADPEEIARLRGRDRARLGCLEGFVDEGLLPAGSGVGSVRDLPSVAELLGRIERELEQGIARLRDLSQAALAREAQPQGSERSRALR